MTTLTRMEVLRRAVAAAHRAADVATTVAWRADAKVAEVVEAAKALVSGICPPPWRALATPCAAPSTTSWSS